MESAGQRLASTPELMHQIFTQLDMRTLLVSIQRVCKTWSDIVQTSHELQRALFFEPVAAPTERDITNCRVLNPLLRRIFTPFYPESDILQSGYAPDRMSFESLGFMDKLAGRQAFLLKEASWRKMQVQQPAAPNIGCMEMWGCMARSFYTDTLEPAATVGGVTMGMLYDVVYRFIGQHYDRSGFRIYWRDPARDRASVGGYFGPDDILAGFSDNVGVVVVRNGGYVSNKKSEKIIHNLQVLQGKYRPKGMELYNPHLQYKGGEDPFG